MDNCPHYALENYTHTQMSAFTHEAMFASMRNKGRLLNLIFSRDGTQGQL